MANCDFAEYQDAMSRDLASATGLRYELMVPRLEYNEAVEISKIAEKFRRLARTLACLDAFFRSMQVRDTLSRWVSEETPSIVERDGRIIGLTTEALARSGAHPLPIILEIRPFCEWR